MLDRAPMDPLSFTKPEDWGKKARTLLNKICPSQSDWKVQDGHIIFLKGEYRELFLRLLLSGREQYTPERLKRNEEYLERAYGQQGVTAIDTRGITIPDVAKRVGEVIHLYNYEPVCDIHSRLENIKEDGYDAATK